MKLPYCHFGTQPAAIMGHAVRDRLPAGAGRGFLQGGEPAELSAWRALGIAS